MSRSSATALLASSVMAAVVATIFAASAQPAKSIPDFSSGQASWSQGNGVNFIAVPGSPSPVANDPAHPHYSNAEARRLGIEPTYRIADLTNPNLKAWAKDVMKKDNDEVLAGKIAYTARSSCKPGGVPGFITLGGGALYIVQSPKEVTMIFDGNAETRHIYLNVPHTANPKQSWYGDSVGHYEGDTLVVYTIAMNDKSFVDAYRTPHTTKIHVTERWRLIENGQKLEVVATVEDPDTFSQPWKAMRAYRRGGDRPLVENICAENNTNLFDYGTPTAKTPDF